MQRPERHDNPLNPFYCLITIITMSPRKRLHSGSTILPPSSGERIGSPPSGLHF